MAVTERQTVASTTGPARSMPKQPKSASKKFSLFAIRPRAAEVIVDGDKVHLVRERESAAGLFALESIIP